MQLPPPSYFSPMLSFEILWISVSVWELLILDSLLKIFKRDYFPSRSCCKWSIHLPQLFSNAQSALIVQKDGLMSSALCRHPALAVPATKCGV